MNIFVLDEDPAAAAIMLCDKHIPKMIVESAQMLSTAHRMLDGTLTKKRSRSGKTMVKYYKYDDERENLYYAAVHHHHPCTKWTKKSKANYNWHFHHFAAMAKEYHYRRGKQHATWEKLGMILAAPPENIPDVPRTEFAQAMKAYPDCLVPGDAVQAYRNYYHQHKAYMAKWNKSTAPHWWQQKKE